MVTDVIVCVSTVSFFLELDIVTFVEIREKRKIKKSRNIEYSSSKFYVLSCGSN